MKYELETTTDAGAPAAGDELSPSGAARTRVMTRAPRHPRRWLLAVGACAAAFLMGERRPVAAASPEDCRLFHQECTEARAAGYRDVGICNVERLECPPDRDAGVRKQSHVVPRFDGHDPERAIGERSIGP